MIRSLMQKLGLDRIGDVVADEARRVQVEVLRDERDVLAGIIAKLDERIRALGGKRRGRPPKAPIAAATAIATRTRKPRLRRIVQRGAGESLREMVAYALAKAGGPVKVTTLVDLVLEAGYKTAAKRSTLLTSIYHVLADTKVFRRFGKGVFELKAEPETTSAKRAAGSTRPSRKARKRRKAAKTRPRPEGGERKPEAAEVKPE